MALLLVVEDLLRESIEGTTIIRKRYLVLRGDLLLSGLFWDSRGNVIIGGMRRSILSTLTRAIIIPVLVSFDGSALGWGLLLTFLFCRLRELRRQENEGHKAYAALSVLILFLRDT